MRTISRLTKNIKLFFRVQVPRIFFVCLLIFYIRTAFNVSASLYNENGPTLQEFIAQWGYLFTIFLYLLKAPLYINVPYILTNIFGVIAFNPFNRRTKLQQIPEDCPFVCFRVVTRGTYPKLVSKITEQNLEMCRKMGMKNFKFEIVTDNMLHLQPSHEVREIVVPADFRTPKNTLFKARALHYCLNDNVNILSTSDWIVHLDEETLLTESVLLGIAQFVSDPKSNIGQGVITYSGAGVENWITTFMDGMRVSTDYGLFRFAFQCLHRPIFGLKGSFIVVKMSIEKDVGFDFGPMESIAEDLRFALTAWDKGYRFDFVEGIMKEKSTFTFTDFVKQRKRWFIGHYHIVWGTSLPLYCKFAVLPLHINTLFSWTYVLNFLVTFFFTDVPATKWQVDLFVLITFYSLLFFCFGNFMSSYCSRFSVLTRMFIGFISQFSLPLLGILESYARVKGLLQRNQLSFELVEKGEMKMQLKEGSSLSETVIQS